MTNTKRNGFKTRMAALEREIRKKKKEKENLEKQEKRSRARWTKGYHTFIKAAQNLGDLRVNKTKRENRLKAIIKAWPEDTVALTKDRDELRGKIAKATETLAVLATKLSTL